MAGLNDLVTDTKTQETLLPDWYEDAQQKVIEGATTAAGAAPTSIADTAAQKAVDVFGDTGAFKTGQDILTSIGEGAANPWLYTKDAAGNITDISPDKSTALGGLFASQQDYLNKMLGDIDTGATTGAIGGGGFGSRMNLSGIARERSKAASDLFQKQMTAALQNQQTGVSAGAGLGNLANQIAQAGINVGTYQQNQPFASSLNMANIISKIQPGQKQVSSEQLGGLNQILGLLSLTEGGLGSLLGGTKTVGGKTFTTPGIAQQLRPLLDKLFTGGDKPTLSGVTEITNPALPGQEGYGWKYYSDGTIIDPSGQYYDSTGALIYSPLQEQEWWSDYDTGSDNWDLF